MQTMFIVALQVPLLAWFVPYHIEPDHSGYTASILSNDYTRGILVGE